MLPAIVSAALPIIDKVLDMIPNAEARERAKRELTLELVRIEADERMKQVELNTMEAAHASIFVAGWRPFIGWVGGVALAWQFILRPIITWIAVVAGYDGTLPDLGDAGELMSLVMAMLGVGAMRSFDKYNEVDTRVVTSAKTKIDATKLPARKPTFNE